jgi:hypothetical protein
VAKIPAGVGPRFPQVVVLVGATGDLSRRKLIPGLLHLATAGFIPSCRIIGVSLDEIDIDKFRKFARDAFSEFSSSKVGDDVWDCFAGDQQKPPTPRHVAMNWARRLKRVFGIDIESCTGCGGKLAIIASIEEPQVIAKILAHLQHTTPQHYQGELPLGARAPPQQSRLG